VLIGCDDGSLVAFNSNEDVEDHFVDLGMRQQVIQGQVGVVSIKNGSVVMGTSAGIIAHYLINGSNVQPEDPQLMEYEQVDSAIIAVSMDDSNNEGLIGTEAGSIFYVNFNEKIVIKLVSSNNNNQSAIDFCKLDPQNSAITVTNCGKKSDELKIFTTNNCDQVMNFQSNFDDDGYVVFVISNKATGKKLKRLVGFSNGVIKRVSFDSLAVEHCFKVPLKSGEKLTCGFYSENDANFAFGTNYGAVFIGSMKTHGRNRVDASYCRIDGLVKTNVTLGDRNSQEKLNIDLDGAEVEEESLDIENSEDGYNYFTGVTSIAFPWIDPIGTMLVAFDDGTIKLWQSAVKNEQLMKILEL